MYSCANSNFFNSVVKCLKNDLSHSVTKYRGVIKKIILTMFKLLPIITLDKTKKKPLLLTFQLHPSEGCASRI